MYRAEAQGGDGTLQIIKILGSVLLLLLDTIYRYRLHDTQCNSGSNTMIVVSGRRKRGLGQSFKDCTFEEEFASSSKRHRIIANYSAITD